MPEETTYNNANKGREYKFIIPGNPQDMQISQPGQPGSGAQPVFKKIGLFNQKVPTKKIIIPNTSVIINLIILGFKNSPNFIKIL
jgi:hypothetical protein